MMQSAFVITVCLLESTTSNRVVSEMRYIQCVAVFAARGNFPPLSSCVVDAVKAPLSGLAFRKF